ncbi:7607_t:CDS:2 [Dentiscutata heterogama]|uniref:7607_t:CDS:1 n=1 Tax=Dentiscutata heterogama TaxID=1316150 RepID=A0ACA9JZM1_9GLOM|nr:7607_t:CDS:2 [Dentiscutata heterogama]
MPPQLSISSLYSVGSERQLEIFRIPSQFDCAFKGVLSLYDLGAIKVDKKSPLDLDQIKDNINKLKKKLNKANKPLYQQLYSASQVISDDSKLVKQLNENLKKTFEQMKPKLMPRVKEICEEFVSSFVSHEYQNILPEKHIHVRTWKESEEEIASVVKELFTLLEEIWINPAFNSELAKSLNEETYQLTIILLLIRVILKNLLFRLFSFISTSKQQSIASSDRKGKGRRRKLDIIFKKTDDGIKLWRETNDDIYWNVFAKDKADIHRYFHIQLAEIPVQQSDADTIDKKKIVQM